MQQLRQTQRSSLLAFASTAVLSFTLTFASSARAQTQSLLYSFTAGTDGAIPASGLITDAAGNLYGTAQFSSGGNGVVYRFSQNSSGGWTQTILYSFSGPDGSYPYAGVVMDSAGNLYGTTPYGGASNCGVVYKLTPRPIAPWRETVLHSFHCGADGELPIAPVTLDSAGNIYGTTPYGGSSPSAGGVAFELSLSGGTWKETVLHTFQGKSDGEIPFAPLILDASGNLYGTTVNGGTACGCGVVFELSKSSGTWKETTLHAFRTADGSNPETAVTFDASGNLWGTTVGGGPGRLFHGVVFELSPNGSGGWTDKTVYAFTGNADGAAPKTPILFDPAGNAYGAAWGGEVDLGTLFELSPDGSGDWAETNLYTWSNSAYPGANPIGPLVRTASGNIYGTTQYGGSYSFESCEDEGTGCGTVFQVTP